jgi:hypothetical protein
VGSARFGRPGVEHLGAHEIPIGIVQDGAHGDDPPAPDDDKFRAFLDTDVDPGDLAVDELPTVPIVAGGKAEWAAYDGDLCVSFETPPAPRRERCAPIEEFADEDGTLEFPWKELSPNGIDLSTTRLNVWLEDGERSWGEPHQIAFLRRSQAPFADLARDAGTNAFTLDVSAPDAEITTVEWGAHSLKVVVEDAAGNWDTATVDVVTYVARYDQHRCMAIEAFAEGLGITPEAMITLGVNGFRALEEAGNASIVPDPPPNEGGCEFRVTWDADDADAIASARPRGVSTRASSTPPAPGSSWSSSTGRSSACPDPLRRRTTSSARRGEVATLACVVCRHPGRGLELPGGAHEQVGFHRG